MKKFVGNETHHWHRCINPECPITDISQMDGYGEHVCTTDETCATEVVCAVCVE